MDYSQSVKHYAMSHRLSKLIFVVILTGGLLASITVFFLSYLEAKEFQDDTLKQIAHLQGAASSSQLDHDHEYSVRVIHFRDKSKPEWLSRDITNGFHEVIYQDNVYRVWINRNSQNEPIAILQPTSERNELAVNSAFRTLIPMLLMFPLIYFFLRWQLKKEFQQLSVLSQQVDQLTEDSELQLDSEQLPTEIKPFVVAINRLLERLKISMQKQRVFIADAAHELRTPIAALSIQANNLERSKSIEQFQDRLVPLKNGIQRTRRLAEQLLDFNRIDSQKYPLSSVSLRLWLINIMSDFMAPADMKSAELVLNFIPDHDTEVITSSDALRLIIGNAIDNAIKYTPDNGQITIQVDLVGKNLHISVRDTGPGLTDDQITNAFQPFNRLDQSCVSGHGLGLAIAKKTAEAIDAKVTLTRPEEGPGLIFNFFQSLV